MMQVYLGNDIKVINPDPSLVAWAEKYLTVRNAEYDKRSRLGYSTYKCPENVSFYQEQGGATNKILILPYGTWSYIGETVLKIAPVYDTIIDHGEIDYGNIDMGLYDYQEKAVEGMTRNTNGILIGPCGAGKTQIGIGMVVALKRKALWITHTNDLLEQSYERAARYMPKEWIGKICGGKVDIGSHLTVATVQTLSRMDLYQYRDMWDVVIVDECHRVCGNVDKIQMFYKVVSNLSAKYKYGLTATLHRSDGMEASVYAVLGRIAYRIPDNAVASRVITPSVKIRFTETPESMSYCDRFGEPQFSPLIGYLASDFQRNQMIVRDMMSPVNRGHSSLILSDRLTHLKTLMSMLPEEEQEKCVMIDGSIQSKKGKEKRQQAIQDMQEGRRKYLFASYGLAKEGLDIQCLDRLYMASPKSDYTVVKQSLGRISRKSPGKSSAICYDYVDARIGMLYKGLYRKRADIYIRMGLKMFV